MRPRRGGRQRLLVTGAIALAAANLASQPIRALRDPLDTDYVAAFAVAARMLRNGDRNIYCIACEHRLAQRLYQVGPAIFPIHFANPPPAAWILQPLTYLSPAVGLAIFLAAAGMALAGAAWMLTRLVPGRDFDTRAAIALGIVSLPGAQAFALGQWSAFLLLAATGALTCLERRPSVAGLLLSLLLLKPQLIWLVPPVLILCARWRILLGFAAGTMGWLIGSLLIVGPHGLEGWPRQVLPVQEGLTAITAGLPGLLSGAGLAGIPSVAAGVIAATGLAAFAWRHRRGWRADVALAVSAGLVASIALGPHALPHDLLLLALPSALLARRRPQLAAAALLLIDAAYVADLVLPSRLAHVEALGLIGLGVLLARECAYAGQPWPSHAMSS